MVSGLCPAGTVSPIGFDRLWRSSRSHALNTSPAAAMIARLARKREDIEHASRCGFLRQVLGGIGETERRGRIARVELQRHDGAGPAAHARDHRNILASVRPAIADRLPDDPAAGLE